MPEDEKYTARGSSRRNKNKSKSSGGIGNQIKDYTKEKAKNKVNDLRRNLGNKNNIQNNKQNNNSNTNNNNKKQKTLLDRLPGLGGNPTIRKAAEYIPGIGGAIKGINQLNQFFSQKNNKKKEKKENENGQKKDDSDQKNKSGVAGQNNSEENKSNILSTFGKGFIKLKTKILIFVIALPLALVFILFFISTAVANYTANFISSTIRVEPLIENFTIEEKNTEGGSSERAYISALKKEYNSNKNFNPDYISSTLAILIDNEQYSNSGSYGYDDITDNRRLQGFFLNDNKIHKLAGIFSKVPANLSSSTATGGVSGNNGTGTITTTYNVGDKIILDVDNVSSLFRIVGSGRPLDAAYIPQTRAIPGEQYQLVDVAATAYENMKAAAAAAGVSLSLNDGYRSYAEQEAVYAMYGSPRAASPGFSEHQLGTTIDVAASDGYAWLEAHGAEYGWFRRYNPADYGGTTEEWHYRYVGKDTAMALKQAQAAAGGFVYFEDFAASNPNIIATESFPPNGNTNTTTTQTTNTTTGAPASSAAKIVEIAKAEEGYTEESGGKTKFGEWYGLPTDEWCAMFISWCANQAGISEDVIPKFSSSATGVSWFEERGLFHPSSDSSYQPKQGDLIFYDHGHVGLVVDYKDGVLTTIEGNTTVTEDKVAVKQDQLNQGFFADVSGYGSPQYPNSATSSTTSSTDANGIPDEVRQELKAFIKGELPKIKSEDKLDEMVDDIFEHKDDYYSLIGKEEDDCDTTVNSTAGSCAYQIKGFNINGNNQEQAQNISNLKVRTLTCDGSGPESGDLIDFEKYVLGVTYAEIGSEAPPEAAKAQAIAARSFALTRPAAMNNSSGLSLSKENDEWVLQIRNCTNDQVYCDPDLGCDNKGPVPQDSSFRAAVAETNGKILVDNNGYVMNTTYNNVVQNNWSSQASQGKSYTELLIEHYSGAAQIASMSCDGSSSSSSNTSDDCVEQNAGSAAAGDYASWSQMDPRWGSISVGGGGSIANIGCLATSIAMLIAKSGVPTIVQGEFNPGTFVQAMNDNGGFVNGGDLVWGAVSNVAPSFQYVGRTSVSGNEAEKAKELIDQGYYVVAQVTGYGSGQHWVAIDRVENGRVIMMDPASDKTDMVDYYPNGMVDTYAYYKVAG